MPQNYVPVGPRELTCHECGTAYTAKSLSSRYCGRPCARKAQAKKPGEPCKQDGCSKKQRARGLCATHYNQTLPGRHKKITVPCDHCGKPAQKEARAKRYAGRYCTERCRDEARVLDTKLRRSQVLAFKPTPLWHTAHYAYKNQRRTTRVWVASTCITCGKPFLDLFGSKACGQECQAAHHRAVSNSGKHRRRARMKNAFVAPVYRQRIYERDNFTCQLCLHPMSMNERAPHPNSPTIDHIIPIARGGAHAPFNVQSACFMCNSTKGDRVHAMAA